MRGKSIDGSKGGLPLRSEAQSLGARILFMGNLFNLTGLDELANHPAYAGFFQAEQLDKLSRSQGLAIAKLHDCVD
ncbi:hypothetical protein J2W59_001920 [Pseudomonas fluorescens]|nr:hypothetical protein [Pseudomonas fluorescens]